MNRLVGKVADVEVWCRNDRYVAKYDAGAHATTWREDEVTHEEARTILKGPEYANRVLLAIQKRLIEAGRDPYISNIKEVERD
jgi:hypothetical protein